MTDYEPTAALQMVIMKNTISLPDMKWSVGDKHNHTTPQNISTDDMQNTVQK